MVPLAAASVDGAENRAKRRQILDGARKVFLESGFDGASVNDIVRETGVSKGTVYAYFPSKERLFETLVFEDRRDQAERLFEGLDRTRPVVRRLDRVSVHAEEGRQAGGRVHVVVHD